MSYNCIANGSIMEISIPPFVGTSRPLTLLSRDEVGTINVEPNSASTIVLVQSTGNLSFVATLTLFISDGLSEGVFNVSCHVTAADGRTDTDLATLLMSGKICSG